MNRCDLEPQLQAIYVHLIDMNGGYDWVSDYLARVAESGEESMDSRAASELKAVRGVMDLIAQVQAEPDQIRMVADRSNPWVEVSTQPDIWHGCNRQFGNMDQAIEFIEGLPPSVQKETSFVLTKCRGGQYTTIENLGVFAIPTKVKNELP